MTVVIEHHPAGCGFIVTISSHSGGTVTSHVSSMEEACEVIKIASEWAMP